MASEKDFTVAKAIRRAIRTSPILKGNEQVLRISDRALQARYQQAAEYWADARAADLKRKLDSANDLFETLLKTEESLRSVIEMLDDGTLCNTK